MNGLLLILLIIICLKVFTDRQKSITKSDDGDSGVVIGQTPQSRLLWAALEKRGIPAKTEYKDGHKTVDIAILEAKLYIEVDGVHHLTDPHQVIADFKRDYYSDREGFFTLRISNKILRTHLNEIANAIADVVQKREDDMKKPTVK